jgi:hypothetical protein
LEELLNSLLTFRSQSHYTWFLQSVGLLLMTASLLVIQQFVPLFRQRNWTPAGFMARTLRVAHGVIAVWALANLALPHMPESVLSVDCVWFNMLMAGIYTPILWLSQHGQLKPDG